MNKKNAQQEIVGFVLIVTVVVIALMVLLIISVKNPSSEIKSQKVSAILTSFMPYTTSCALVFEPEYQTIEELFKSCAGGKICKNNNQKACDVLNQTLTEVSLDAFATESSISAYEITFLKKEDRQGLLKISEGNCTAKTSASAQKNLLFHGETLLIRLKICK